MVLNKKGWHKFMSICLCIAALCITSKHSLLPLETGEGRQGQSTLQKGSGTRFLCTGETPPLVSPSELPQGTFVFSITLCHVVFSPGTCLRPSCSSSLPGTLLITELCFPSVPPVINLSFSLTKHCSGIGVNYTLITRQD